MTRRKLIIALATLVILSAVAAGLYFMRSAGRQRSSDIDYASEGGALLKSGRITEAVVNYNRGIASAPTKPEPYIGLAVLYELVNRPDLAIETLEQLRAANPKAAHLGCRLAEAHLGAEDLKQAREIGAKAVVDEPGCVRAHSVYGLTMLRFRYWDTAAEELRKAIRMAPEDADIGQVLVDVLIQKAAYDEAIALGESLLPKAPQSARLQYKLGWSYGRRQQQGDSTVRAIDHLNQAIKLAPDWFEPYAELGRVYLSQGKKEEARTAFERSWKLNPQVPGVAFNLANLYRGRNEGRSLQMDRTFHKLLKEKEQFTAMRRDYNAGAENSRNVLDLSASEGDSGLIGVALHRLRKLLNDDPGNLDALKLYVRLDQRARAGTADYLRPGPGLSVPGL